MDDVVRQLVMERLAPTTGSTAEDSAAPVAPTVDPASLLSERVSDPLMAAVLGSMLNRQPEVRTAEDEADAEHKLERARASIRRLRRELAVAEAMALYIGETFGACQSCWGLNRTCPKCRGRGGPGFAEPNEEELLAWVRPALTRLGFELSRAP
jgi:hypothetical protein